MPYKTDLHRSTVSDSQYTPSELVELAQAKAAPGPRLIEIKCALGARSDLGRPTASPQENKRAFMAYLSKL